MKAGFGPAVLVWLALAALVWLAAPAVGRDVYVDNQAGDDRSDGSSPQPTFAGRGPARTIAKGLRIAQAGDRVVLAATSEPYRESVSLTASRHSGSPVGPFVVEGNGAVLEGLAAVPRDAWRPMGGDVFAFEPSRLGYQQLFVDGRPAVRRPTTPSDVRPPGLAAREWCLSGGKILFAVEPGRLPVDHELACSFFASGITLYHVRGVVIRNLVIQGFQVDGVAASDGVRDARLENVTARANGRSGVSVAGASMIELADCLLEGNGDSQLRSEDFGQTYLRASRLIGDTAPAVAAFGGRVVELPPLSAR
jgi:hypothetical protein